MPTTPVSNSPADVFAQQFSATRRGARLARLLAGHQMAVWGHPHGTCVHDTVTLVVGQRRAARLGART